MLRRRLLSGNLPIGRLLFELFLIFVAVAGALFANAWWQDRMEIRDARAAVQGIHEEFSANRAQIAERIDHHRRVVQNAQGLVADIAVGKAPPRSIQEIRERLTDGQGLRTAMLSRAAFDGALLSGSLRSLPAAELRPIAQVYEVQRRLDALIDALIVNFVNPAYYLPERLPSTAVSLVVTFEMMVEMEAGLLRAFDGLVGPAPGSPTDGGGTVGG